MTLMDLIMNWRFTVSLKNSLANKNPVTHGKVKAKIKLALNGSAIVASKK
jgi:hypothetical protein